MNTALHNPDFVVSSARPRRARRALRRLAWLGGVTLLLAALLLWQGGYLLVKSDPLPARADAAVVLQGSLIGGMVRVVGGVRLLQQGIPARLLLSVPRQSYWDVQTVPAAKAYLSNRFDGSVTERTDFCETDEDVNSTGQEARAVIACMRQLGMHSIVVVTSDYHTRRAGIIWRNLLAKEDPGVQISMYGVADPEYQAAGWWRKRIYAKTWVTEFSKLVWVLLGGN